MEDLDQI